MFFLIEWLLMVSIWLFKCTFAGPVVYFPMIISKVSCNFCFLDYVCNLSLVAKWQSGLFIQIEFIVVFFSLITSLLCKLIINQLIHPAVTYFQNIFSEYFLIFWLFRKCFWIKKRKYLPMLLETFFEGRVERDVSFSIFIAFLLLDGLYWYL